MDAEKLRELWWTPSEQTLPCIGEEWAQESWSDPDSFWPSLIDLQKKMSLKPPASILGERFDFYHDCLLRHAESNTAFIAIEEGGFSQTWNYKRLHRLVNYQVKEWVKQSLQPGQTVLINLPPGLSLVVALLTALRMGLKLSYLPSSTPFLGDGLFATLLEMVSPDIIITHPSRASYSGQFKTLLIDELNEDDQNHEPLSFAYPGDEIIQDSIALHREDPLSIVSLTAKTTYLHALASGLMALNLQPGTTWASTLSCPLRSQPCSTLMTLLAGATILHIPEATLTNDPLLLKNEKIHFIDISPLVIKLGAKVAITPSKQLKAIDQSPFIHQNQAWKAFLKLNKLEDVPAFQLLMDNSYGGALLMSKPKLTPFDNTLKPLFGMSWSLSELNESGDTSTNGFGIFSPVTSEEDNDQNLSNLILAQHENSCLISGFKDPCLEGVTIPTEFIEESVAKLPFVESCLLHTPKKMGEMATSQMILLIFTSPLENNVSAETKQGWTQDIFSSISREVGPAFVPNIIEYYPLSPPQLDPDSYRDWCVDQYSSGNLSKKRNSQIHQLLGMLKALTQEK